MKIIKVGKCLTCPNRSWGWPGQYEMCRETKKHLTTIASIPDSCTLEDDQDLTPALELLQGHLDNECWVQQYSNLNGFPDYYHLVAQDGYAIVSGKTIKELLVNLVKKEGK